MGIDPQIRRVSPAFLLASFSIVVIGAVLRLYASWDNFWLDEIWSWRFAAHSRSYWQIATQIPHDNNQILNTWIVYTLSPDVHWTLYRIPAVMAGVGTVIFAGLCGLRRSPCECVTALLLTSGSFVLIQYSSEARGYAYLLFFTMFCFWLMERVATTPRAVDEWLFAISASLGFLGHFLFAGAYAGLFAWSLASVLKRHRGWDGRAVHLFRLHSLPILTIIGLACCFAGQMKTGGGERQRLSDVLVQAGSLAVGGPESGSLAIVCCSGAILASIAGTVLLRRRNEGLFYFVVASTIALALMIWIAKPPSIYMRHFLIPVMCVILIINHLLARAWVAGVWGKTFYVVALGTILAGNSVQTWPLLKNGRGGYEAALAFMLAESKSPRVTVGSDFDFRNSMVLDYYYRRLTDPKPLDYYPHGKWPPRGPEWIILHSFQKPPNPMPDIQDFAGNRYQLRRVFPYGGLSGWQWTLYQRTEPDKS